MATIKDLKILTLLFFTLLILYGCEPSEPRPIADLNPGTSITSPQLRAYSSPKCILNENTISCTFINYNFNINSVSIYNRDSIIATDINDPKNKVKLSFRKILDQDGIYEIIWPTQQVRIYPGSVSVEFKGNNFGPISTSNSATDGDVYVKQMPNGIDIVICNAKFKYKLNSVNYDGVFNAHFFAPK